MKHPTPQHGQAAVPQGAAAAPATDEMNTRLSTIESRVQWASQQMGALVADVAALKNSLQASEIHNSKMAAANRVLGGRVRELMGQIHAHEAQYSQLVATNVELQQIAEGLSDAHTSLEKQYNDQVAMNRQLQATMRDLETALDNSDEESTVLRRAIAARDEEIERMTEALKMAHRNAQRLRDAKTELETTLDAGDTNKGALLRKISEKDKEIIELRESLEEAVANQKLVEHEKVRAEESASDLQAEVKRLRAKLLTRARSES